jgi:hypothetical protein
MFGLFKKTAAAPAVDVRILDETVQRWRTFAAKIRERADELYDQGFVEALRLRQNAPNPNDNAHYLFWSGITGQIGLLRDKLRVTFQEKVEAAFEEKAGTYVSSRDRFEFSAEVDRLRRDLRDEEQALDTYLSHKSSLNLERFESAEEPELMLNQVLQEFAALRDQFACSQCGAPLKIERPFFMATYVDCGHCRTKSTFYPSDAAYALPVTVEKVAEHRVRALKQSWRHKADTLPIWSPATSDVWHAHKREVLDLHAAYMNAKFDVMDTLLPELKPQHDLVRHSRIKEMENTALR